jgi:hypothetical protein
LLEDREVQRPFNQEPPLRGKRFRWS